MSESLTTASRKNITLKQNWTNKGNNNGRRGLCNSCRNGCNQKCGRENMHRTSPNATKITRHAKNACGIEDKMTTKVAAVKRIKFA